MERPNTTTPGGSNTGKTGSSDANRTPGGSANTAGRPPQTGTSYSSGPGSSSGTGPSTAPTGASGSATGGQSPTPSGVIDQTTSAVNELVGTVQQEATRRLTDQVRAAHDGLGSTADAMRSVGNELRESNQVMLAEVANRAASEIETAANYLRDKDLDQLMGDAESFARRQPVMFVAGATFLGMLAARFLKSSAPRPQPYPTGYPGAADRAFEGPAPRAATSSSYGTTGTHTTSRPTYPGSTPPAPSGRTGGTMGTPSRPATGPEASTGSTPGSTRP